MDHIDIIYLLWVGSYLICHQSIFFRIPPQVSRIRLIKRLQKIVNIHAIRKTSQEKTVSRNPVQTVFTMRLLSTDGWRKTMPGFWSSNKVIFDQQFTSSLIDVKPGSFIFNFVANVLSYITCKSPAFIFPEFQHTISQPHLQNVVLSTRYRFFPIFRSL